MSLGLGGLMGMGNYCHMCASHYCVHTIGGMAQQQQMGMQQYNDLLRQATGLGISVSSGASVTIATGDSSPSISVKPPEDKSFDKKLLLLRR